MRRGILAIGRWAQLIRHRAPAFWFAWKGTTRGYSTGYDRAPAVTNHAKGEDLVIAADDRDRAHVPKKCV